MKPSRELFWQRIVKERHDTFMAFGPGSDGVPFEMAEREYLALQKKLLDGARMEWERRHIKRLIAHDILNVAHPRAKRWEEFSRVLRRIERLGFIDLDNQVHTACLALLWVSSHDRDRAPMAWEMMEDAERRLRRIRQGHFRRKEGLDAIASVKQQVAKKGLTPPTPTRTESKPKGTSRRRGTER
ncbi:hypothetical protein JRI60_21710 [Archangium violaceum]|uniref:hypothetical protein n=1 Tax=Archangium violaceum TaxID=83451 RepID=UPI001950C988|nr:hypothetical protein [Archangium violaceum]QRO01446.1 hypothetical protein JRI60_21710 [Archangium violaceum]